MKIGDEITWCERVWAKTAGAKRVRYITGVIIGERVQRERREFELAVRWLSGNLPKAPSAIMWVPERDLLLGRSSPSQHVHKIAPVDLLRRQHRQALTRVRKDAQEALDLILANVDQGRKAA